MMIKDILVTIPTGDASSFALNYSVSVARTFDAHLTGVAFIQELATTGSSLDGATAVVLDHYRRELEVAAEAAKARFEKSGSEKASPPNRWSQLRSDQRPRIPCTHRAKV
jgi:hypothetical protein